MKNVKLLGLLALIFVLVFTVGACAPAAAPAEEPVAEAPAAEEPAEEAPAPEPTEAPMVEEPAEAAPEPVTLTVWSWRPEDEDSYNEIFDVYEAAHPGVTVEFVAYVNTDYNNILATGLTGKGGPDVPQVRSYGGIQPLIEAGQLLPLDDGSVDLSIFPAANLKSTTSLADGHVYAVPLGVQAFTAYYNADIFDELGLTEPTTWDEWIADLDAIKAAGYTAISTPGKDVWMFPLVQEAVGASRYGGPAFEADILSGAKDFNDPDYIASIQLVKDLQPYFPEDVVGVGYEDARTLFITGQAGVFLGGSFEIGYWRNNAPEMNIGAFVVPTAADAVAGPFVPGWFDGSFGINALSEHPEEAKELVSWMATPEFGQLFTEKIKMISAVPGMKPADPLLQEFSDLFAQYPSAYMHLVDFRYGDPWGSNLMAEGVQKMMLDEMTAEEVGAHIQTGVSQWFTPGQ